MSKYSNNDLKLVFDNYINAKRLSVTSEILRGQISTYAKDFGFHEFYSSKYPYTAIWKITSGCNLRCKHCFFFAKNEYDNSTDLLTQDLYNIIDQLSEIGVVEVRLTGGEIFLRKDIFEIIKYIKKHNISIIITSNGTTLNKSNVNKLKKLLHPKTDIVRISLEGADAQTNDVTRGKGSFNKAINAIKLLTQNGIKTFVSSTITNLNITQIKDLYFLCDKLEVEQITYIKMISLSPEQYYLIPDSDDIVYEMARLLKSLKGSEKTCIDSRLFTPYDFLKNEKTKPLLLKELKNRNLSDKNSNYYHCNPDKSFYIDSDGKVFLCPLSADYKIFELGDLKKENLENIFSKRKNNILFSCHTNESPVCKDCSIINFCKGGCMVKAFVKNGYLPSHSCNTEITD